MAVGGGATYTHALVCETNLYRKGSMHTTEPVGIDEESVRVRVHVRVLLETLLFFYRPLPHCAIDRGRIYLGLDISDTRLARTNLF